MLRSPGFRFIIVGVLILLMFIPVMFVGQIVDARADYNRSAQYAVGQEWGGEQLLSGPVLILPVEETVIQRDKREVLDPDTGLQQLDSEGKPLFRYVDEERTLRRDPVYLYPDRFTATADTETQVRYRGIFSVPVYSAEAMLEFDFPTDAAPTMLTGAEVILWDEAEINVSVSSNRALRGEAQLTAGEQMFQMEPLPLVDTRVGGISAPTGDPRAHESYRLTLEFNGAGALSLTPVGRASQITITSDWPHPSFQGAFLPDGYEVGEDGFSARWSIPHLARPLPQLARVDQDLNARDSAGFGVSFYQPNDFYQKAYRAARYGILFIGLTFLTIFLIEGQTRRPTHPVQYILVGLAQSVFFLLMLALAEQMGFGPAYLVSGGATVALITAFAVLALGLGRRSLVLGAMLAVLYAVLYLILQSADYALLAGSVLSFVAVAGTMFATRNENWYGEKTGGDGGGWFRRKAAPAGPEETPPPA